MKVISGTWTYANGIPIAGGTVVLKLGSPDTELTMFTTNTQQIASSIVQFKLDNTGSLPAGTKIWFNDEIVNPNTFYIVAVSPSGGGAAGVGKFTITGASFNFNNNTPTIV